MICLPATERGIPSLGSRLKMRHNDELLQSRSNRSPHVEALIVATGAKIENRKWHGFYDAGEDVVCIPDRFRFYSTGHYYEKHLQLLAYWAERRVGFVEQHENRDRGLWDVVADLASSFVCNELQVPKGQPIEERVAWLQLALEERSTDEALVNQAAEKANVIADYLLSFRATKSDT